VDELLWSGGTWSPGGEYPKKLVLKNVSRDIMVVKYRLPKSRFFHMEFPEPIRLRCVRVGGAAAARCGCRPDWRHSPLSSHTLVVRRDAAAPSFAAVLLPQAAFRCVQCLMLLSWMPLR
jgi:hypothetical protein